MNTDLLRAYMVHRNRGSVVGQDAMCALRRARAELEAARLGWYCCWEYEDEDPSDFYGDHEYWCRDAKRGKCTGHEVLWCGVYAPGTRYPLASIGGIIDPDYAFRRDIEAELFSEALTNERETAAIMHL